VIKEFSNDFIQTFDQLSVKYDNILIRGDLNYNMLLDNSKSTPLNNVCDIFDFSNLIKKATCFTIDALPTLIDVILSNKPNKCQNATHFNCGLSDYHNLISDFHRALSKVFDRVKSVALWSANIRKTGQGP
jgi:hypothetical protein